ncbi:MAG: DUF262 domain-containing protein [Candidatus Helarchaeota archaeon]
MTEIKGSKIKLNDLFKRFWFNIPEYQRHYVWQDDQINDLLDDLTFAFDNHPENEYFLGSLVLHKKKEKEYEEFDVLDGQQRLTTIILLLAFIRDISNDELLKKTCEKYIFQEENKYDNIPEKIKLSYKIRGNVDEYIDKYIKTKGGTMDINIFRELQNDTNSSISNMSNAILLIKRYKAFEDIEYLSNFAQFLFNKVIFIYVSTSDFEDAYRLFTILNNRGIPLRNSDIIKSINIGEIKKEDEKTKYGKKWEKIGDSFKDEDEFDRFLSFIRTIIVKEKARVSLLKEYEKIYEEKQLEKGKPTIDLLTNYQEIYEKTIELIDFDIGNDYKNLITIMKYALPSTDWIPPLLFFYDQFGKDRILEFLKKLEFKFVGDWILQQTPTTRITNMNQVLKVIEDASKDKDVNKVLDNKDIFFIDKDALRDTLNGKIYRKRFSRYILLKREYLLGDDVVHISNHKYITVEHVLPQNPRADSLWRVDFDNNEIEEWKDKIGNLILISKRKNSKLSNLDFKEKKERYLKGRIDIFPSSKIFADYNEWTLDTIKKRQELIINMLVNG